MRQCSSVLVLVVLLALTGCGVQGAALRQSASTPSVVPSSVQTTATTVQPSAVPATPSRPRYKPTPVDTTPQPVISQMITPSITLLPDANGWITSISFIDAQHGWMGFGTSVRATEDGGHQWHTVYTATETIDALDFVSAQQGWALIGERVFATQDSGTTWNQLIVDHNGHIYMVDFVDAHYGWIATFDDDVRATLLRTIDGGTT